MRYRPLGQSGIQASVVAFGAWAIGGWMWGGTDEEQAVRGIHEAIALGINFIDTAPLYGFGRSEEIIGKAIKGKRDRVVLATKCNLRWDREEGELRFACDDETIFTDKPDRKVFRNGRPDSIREEIERSLTLLQTDHVDLYQTHWQDPTTPISETMGCLLDLKRQGKIRAIGVSNATTEQIDEYLKVGPLDTAQERYSMLDLDLEKKMLPHCIKHGIAMLAYAPLGQGMLTGKLDPKRVFGRGDFRASKARFNEENRKKAIALMQAIDPIAKRHRLTSAQLAVAWALSQPGITHALCGCRNPEQVRDNAGAGDAVLTSDECATIDAAIQQHVADVPGWY